ncbi:hypothetical protein D3C80_285180 [compost metagenome]
MAQALQQFFHQLFAALAAEGFAFFNQHLTVEPDERLFEAGATFLADAQLRAGADQRDLFGQGIEQAAGQLQAGLAVVTDHRAEMLGFHDPVDGDDRNALGLQLAIAVVAGRQAAGNDQCVAAPGAEQLQQLPFAVRRIVGTGDQQLITPGPRTLFQQFGDSRVTGVFQIRQNEPQCAGVSAAQSGGLWVRREAMLFDDRAHAFDGSAADALLFGLAIDDIAGGGDGHTGQLGNITEFQPAVSLFFRDCLDIFVNPNRLRQATIVATHPTSWTSRMGQFRVTCQSI